MEILVSTITREALPDEPSSAVYRVSLSDKALRKIPVPDSPMRGHDLNSRGGMRGARGVAVAGDEIFVANYDSILRYDREWRLLGYISHPHCADIHDIAFRDEILWVASTLNDLIFHFDRDGHAKEIIDLWGNGHIAAVCGIPKNTHLPDNGGDPRVADRALTDRFHLNSFAFSPDGDLILSLGQVRVNGHFESALVKLVANGDARVVYRNLDAPVPSHNIVFMPDGTLLHAETANARVIRVDPVCQNTAQTILETNGGYTRGLCMLENERAAVGVQNEVWIFLPSSGQIEQRIRISEDPRESVHSIAVMESRRGS